MSAAIDHGYLQSTKHIINHDIMHCTADGVIGNHLYSGRALGFSEPMDVIQLHPALKSQWNEITGHYNRIGLSHTEEVIWDLSLDVWGPHIGYKPSVFYYGPRECRQWGDRQWLEVVDYINSKNNFVALADKLGVDVPHTLCFDRPADVGHEAIRKIVFPCYVKAAVSVSGVGIHRCANEAEIAQALSTFEPGVPIQIQEEAKTNTFLNLQYMVIGRDLIRLAASEQILDGFVHQGNRFPASHEPWDAVDAMAYWLQDHGIKGVFAFDVAVLETGDGVRFQAIECNPRFNGATYPTMIAQKLRIPEWSAATFSTGSRRLADIDLSGLEYDAKTGEGAIIVNWGTVLEGKVVILMAGSAAFQDALKVELVARL